MKIAVAGGTGRVGSRVVNRLRDTGHEVIPMSPSTGVDTLRAEDVAPALEGVTVVVDVTDSPSTDAVASRTFFETSTANLLAAGAAAGVQHHVLLSVLGAERIHAGYFRAKSAQEGRVAASGVPYSIVRATQLFERVAHDAVSGGDGRTIPVGRVPVQPVAADDVARVVAHVATGAALNGDIEVAGPERLMLDELVSRVLSADNDARKVVPAAHARFLGVDFAAGDRTLLPELVVTEMTLDRWLSEQRPRKPAAS